MGQEGMSIIWEEIATCFVGVAEDWNRDSEEQG